MPNDSENELSVTLPGGAGGRVKGYRLADLAWPLLIGGVAWLIFISTAHDTAAQTDKAQVRETLSKSNADVAAILKEQNAAQREQNAAIVKAITESNERTVNALSRLTSKFSEGNCLNDPLMKNRADAREFCKRISRDDR